MSDRASTGGDAFEPPPPPKGPEPMPDTLIVMESGVSRVGPKDPEPKVVKTNEYAAESAKLWLETLLSPEPTSFLNHCLSLRALLELSCVKFDTDDTLRVLPHADKAEELIPLAERMVEVAPLVNAEARLVMRNIDTEAVQGAKEQLKLINKVLEVIGVPTHDLTAKQIQLETFLDDTMYSFYGRIKGLAGVSRRVKVAVEPINARYTAAAAKGQETKKLVAKVADKTTQETLDLVEEELAKQRPPAAQPAPTPPTPTTPVLSPEFRRNLKRPGRS